MLIISITLFIIGLIILVKSADILVSGSSSIASKLNINPMVIGLTIVAFGTSSPELVVSITSALKGNTDVAFGNVVGSNIFNILIILGLCAVIYPLHVNKNTVWKEIPMSFLAAVIMAILGFQQILDSRSLHLVSIWSKEVIGSISFSNGLVLLSFFIIFLYYTFGIAKINNDNGTVIEKIDTKKSFLFIFIGMFGLVLGSKILVDNAIILAKTIGMSDLFIGLTIVAAGTSMPELATSIVATRKRKMELAVGNIVGSNIFNIFFILGTTSLIKSIPLRAEQSADIIVLLISTLLLFISLFIFKKRSISRIEGGIMLCFYFAYIAFIIYRG